MKNSIVKLISLALALLMLIPFVFTGCAKEPDKSLEIKIYALNGTTALGMAQMIDQVNKNQSADPATVTDAMNYNISLFTAADQITAAITTGECAIAALPTNVAAKLYQKTSGGIQLLAINTLGVLYLLDNTGTVNSIEDLRGKTIYLPGSGSNPEFITAALMKAYGLQVGSDVILDTTSYNSPDALQQAVISGAAELAVLPEPKVSVITTQKPEVKVALNLTTEWDIKNGKNTMVQGCLVVNSAFAKEHPTEVSQFLADYQASVEYIKEGSDEAIEMIVNAGILPKAAIAKKALPKCNICCLTGDEMKLVMDVFCQKLFELNPASVGAIPDDGFYYKAK